MLRTSDEPNYIELIEEHPLKLAIPPQIQLELRQRGPISTCDEDVRVAPRFRCNGPAVLEWLESPCGLPIAFPTTQVLVRNLSRTGFSVLADRQWYPEQLVKIYLPIAIITAKIIRARRLGSRCYDLGCRVLTFKRLVTVAND